MRHIFILILLSCIAVNAQGQKRQTKEEKTEALVLSKIRALPEVRDFFRVADKRELPDVIIDNTPNADNGWEYRVKVGYSKYMFRSNLLFDVKAKNLAICYEDWGAAESPKEITLQSWRHWRKSSLPETSYI